MGPEELRRRSRKAALDTVALTESAKKDVAADVMARQLVRSATSTAANYRSACRARSHADFINKLGIVIEEADESVFWLELMLDAGKVGEHSVKPLIDEYTELLKIFVASRQTARARHR